MLAALLRPIGGESRASTSVAGRVAAGLALLCLGVHVVLLLVGGPLRMVLPMLVLSSVCAGCAARAWTAPSVHDALAMLAGGAAMVVLHLGLLHGVTHDTEHSGATGHEHQHGHAEPGADQGDSDDLLMHVGVSIAALQALAAGILWLDLRRRQGARESADRG